MRILHVLPSLNSVTGGPVTAVSLLLKELAKQGHYVELYTTNWPEVDSTPIRSKSLLEDYGVVVKVFPVTPIFPLYHVPYSKALVAAVRDSQGRFDMYHASSLWNPLITHTMKVFRRCRMPYVVTCHGMLDPVVFARNRFAKWVWGQLWERNNVEYAELIQFTSEEELRKAQNSGWRLRRTLVMPINVDISAGLNLPPHVQLVRDYPQLEGKQVILFVGRINWVKNLDLLVEALAQLRTMGRDTVLLCVGPGSDGHREALERQAANLGVRESLVFTGLLEGEALRSAYACANVAALVSQKENFGLAAAEALSAGVSVVLSDGVDMGKHWSAPPVWRVEQSVESITLGLSAALDYSMESEVACETARQLADQEWGQSQIQELVEAFENILIERHL